MKKVIMIISLVIILFSALAGLKARKQKDGGSKKAIKEASQIYTPNPVQKTCAEWQAAGKCPKPADPRSCREIIAAGECPMFPPQNEN
ncbi:MAG: hypothetical protein FWC98_02050 [Bacteroidales bacterium]|nr:hypothetical protein [Bacteroidales bacterium]